MTPKASLSASPKNQSLSDLVDLTVFKDSAILLGSIEEEDYELLIEEVFRVQRLNSFSVHSINLSGDKIIILMK